MPGSPRTERRVTTTAACDIRILDTGVADPEQLRRIFNAARSHAGCFTRPCVKLAEFERLIEGEVLHVASHADQITGFAAVWQADQFIHHLYVDPGYQGMGIGTALLAHCEQAYGRPLSLKCPVRNAASMHFYRQRGWIARDAGEGEDGPWERLYLEAA